MRRHWNTFGAGKLVYHYRVIMNDSLGLDHRIVQYLVSPAGRLDAELMKIFVVILHHAGQVLGIEVAAR